MCGHQQKDMNVWLSAKGKECMVFNKKNRKCGYQQKNKMCDYLQKEQKLWLSSKGKQ